MARELSDRHAAVQELLGVYALDAVDGDEATMVEAHLVSCPRCRDEVEAHREVAAALANSGLAAPEGLWDSIAAELAQRPPEATVLDFARSGSGRWASRSRRMQVLAGVASIAAALALVLGVAVVRQDQRLNRLSTAVHAQDLSGVARAAMLTPGARRVDLRSGDRKVWVGAVVLPDGHGYVVEHNLPALGSSRTYQLWALVGDRKVSLGVLGARPSTSGFTMSGQATALAVTAEQAGGVVTSQQNPVVVGFMPVEQA